MENVRRKIILVDDFSMHLISTKERLKNYYEIYPAQTTEILLEVLQKITPELILLDINMPENDGYAVIKILKGNPRYANIPVIFLTSKYDKKSIIQGMSLGAVDFVTKPFSDLKLVECIESHLDPEKREKPIILAIDDNPSILQSVNNLLHDQYKVYTLPKPENLKKLLDIVTPDLFLLDCQMPGIHGFDLVPMIRKIQVNEETPIIFLTSEGSVDAVSVAINLGACDFIIKPINEVVLRDKMALHLKDYIMRRHIRSLHL